MPLINFLIDRMSVCTNSWVFVVTFVSGDLTLLNISHFIHLTFTILLVVLMVFLLIVFLVAVCFLISVFILTTLILRNRFH